MRVTPTSGKLTLLTQCRCVHVHAMVVYGLKEEKAQKSEFHSKEALLNINQK